MTAKEIVTYLPYTDPFLFVDEILEVDDQKIVGVYTYKPSLEFYKGHFKDHPVTPGVILIETMAQIGLVCLGIYLRSSEFKGVEGPAEKEESIKARNEVPTNAGYEVSMTAENAVSMNAGNEVSTKAKNAVSMKYNEALDAKGLIENTESKRIDSFTTNRRSLESTGTIALTSSSIDFLKPIYPAEKVTVHAEKVYYRFNKLKCNVRMMNEAGELVCQGSISGMMKD
jgi:3-hydroxyacyl-[acyl-carrier-protein] dehydratase